MNNTTTLKDDFQKKFNIKEVFQSFRGGQKEVYLVELNTGERVAIKIFHSFGDREKKEIELYQKYKELKGVPTIISVSEYDNRVVLVEEYIDGKTLRELGDAGEFAGDATKISALLKAAIEVLRPVWEDGLVHRDLKPENIMVASDGAPVIIDFGIVKDLAASTITETGFQPNSWKFAAPEQLFAKKDLISYRTDFFSLGVIGYFLYHGSLPFGSSKEEVRDNLGRSDSVVVCEEGCLISGFCQTACKVTPSERPRNVDSLIHLLP